MSLIVYKLPLNLHSVCKKSVESFPKLSLIVCWGGCFAVGIIAQLYCRLDFRACPPLVLQETIPMHIDVRQRFGRRLADLRKQRGWTQEVLALESGLARSYLGGVERGQRNVSLVNICLLADTLSVRPSELLDIQWQGEELGLPESPQTIG